MSVEMTPAVQETHDTTHPVEEIARSWVTDERLEALVPGFDAPFFQAGLAGYSDGPMRLIARRHGCPFCVTEALLDRILVEGGKGRTREDPDLLAETCGTGDPLENRIAGLEDHPVAGQIMGSEPGMMSRAAGILVDYGYEVIDVNLACPVRKIRKRHRGGHLLAHPRQAIAILREVRKAVPDSIPITVKMRRAWDDTPDMAGAFEEIFIAAYDIGCAWVTVHCRSVEQKYKGPGDWTFLADLAARHPRKLLFGSGDIWTAGDIFRMLSLTGVTGVSVARGCIGNPWIFHQARQMMSGLPPTLPDLSQQRDALVEHFGLAVALHGDRPASRMMRKFGIKFSVHHPHADEVRTAFIHCRTSDDWTQVIRHWYG